ncbi:MAG: ribosome silencing factor [Clostridiaceae bacterium]|nr:ribosome silencing factor [Clostridiaceae bacterium]
MSEQIMAPKTLMEAVARIADSKKARDIISMRVTERTTLADYFLMMTGTSTTHIRALSDEIEHKLKEQGVAPHHVEGVTSSWILMDYGTVVANIFLADAREMYALERLWGDAEPVDLSNIVTKED